MPLLQIHSLESFCAWLIDAFTSTVPFGLSLRLRPLLISPEASVSKAVVLVRPHLGHVLLSATSQESGVDTFVESAAVRQTSRPSSAAGAVRSASENDARKEASFAAVLQALLLLTRSDASYAVKSAGATGFSAAALDGVGRKVHLFTTLLHHCVSWWSTGDVGAAQHAPRRRLSLPFLFLGDAPVAAPVASAGGLAQEQQQQRRAQLSFLRVLRRLSQHGGWQLTSAFSRQKETQEQGEDWLDYLVRRAVTCDLQPAGDYMDFVCGSLSDSSPSASTFPLPVVSVDVVRAVLWHVLSTEVDGDVLAALHRLLCDFIVSYGPGVAEREESRRGNTDPPEVPLSRVRFALERLVRQPELVLLCSPAASSVSASSPPIKGPVSQSRILPAGVLVLPFIDDSSGSSVVLSTSSSPRFFLRGVRHATGSAGKGGAVSRGAVRVLLLRVDPEGGWMPSAETQACQRSFYASFQAQAERDGPRESLTPSADAVESGDEDFAAWEARGLGQRAVEKVPLASQRDTVSPGLSLGLDEHSSAEDTAVTMLTAHVLRHPPFASAVASASAADRLLWRATIRLYLYALLHRARVVLTPEQLPAFTKAFGYRHVHSLHRVLCQVGATWMTDEAAAEAQTRSQQGRVSRLLATVCTQEPPVAIYLVDQLSLAAFTHLQRRAPDLSSMRTSVFPVTLCRDVLRLPESAQYSSHETGVGDLSPGILTSATHCAVLDEQVLCTAWSALPSSYAADSLMETCAGLEKHFLPNSRTLCVVAFSPWTSAPLAHLPSATAQDHMEERDARWQPSLLLVAPTRVHALYYCGLLRKAGLALLEALPDARGSGGCCAEGITDQRSSASLSGVVRGGGAFYVALAKHLHQLRSQLYPASQSLLSDGTNSVPVGPEAGALSWGDDIPLRERRWVCYLLQLLTEACAAVATHHAEPIIASSVGARSEPAMAGVEARTWTCGPRARRRLWLRVLRDVVEERSAAPCPTPMLHVRHLDGVDAFERLREQVDEDSALEALVKDDTFSLNALGMQVFAAHEMPSWRRDAAFRSAAERTDRDAACEDKCCREPELFEPLSTNVRAVRESLALLLRTLSATIF